MTDNRTDKKSRTVNSRKATDGEKNNDKDSSDLDRFLRDAENYFRHERQNPSGSLYPAYDVKYLDTAELELFEKTFRKWSEESSRADVRISRKRILLIFLLIRYTGARLGEILALNGISMIDPEKQTVTFGHYEDTPAKNVRTVEIPPALAMELSEIFSDISYSDQDSESSSGADSGTGAMGSFFNIDPAHVRRKFYEIADRCGFSRKQANPGSIRRSRAIELIRNNIPLTMVQKILGHSTSGLTSSYIDCSDDSLKKVLHNYIDRESRRKTSARNSFFGAVSRIKTGDIQSEVEITTLSGIRIVSVITNESLERLLLSIGMPVTADIKAPWVMLAAGKNEPAAGSSNILKGKVKRIMRGAITAEIVVGLDDGTEVCSLVTEQVSSDLDIRNGMDVWVMFSAFSVILQAG